MSQVPLVDCFFEIDLTMQQTSKKRKNKPEAEAAEELDRNTKGKVSEIGAIAFSANLCAEAKVI